MNQRINVDVELRPMPFAERLADELGRDGGRAIAWTVGIVVGMMLPGVDPEMPIAALSGALAFWAATAFMRATPRRFKVQSPRAQP